MLPSTSRHYVNTDISSMGERVYKSDILAKNNSCVMFLKMLMVLNDKKGIDTALKRSGK